MTEIDVKKDSGKTGTTDSKGYGMSFCTSNEKLKKASSGQLLGQEGEVVGDVATNSFNNKKAHVIPRGSVGLDSMSSVDVFGDSSLLTNIRTVDESMRIICNAGSVIVTKMGDLEGYGPVWYHEDAIANILSLSNVQKLFR